MNLDFLLISYFVKYKPCHIRRLLWKRAPDSFLFLCGGWRERAQRGGSGSVNNTITYWCEELIGLGNIYHVTLTSWQWLA